MLDLLSRANLSPGSDSRLTAWQAQITGAGGSPFANSCASSSSHHLSLSAMYSAMPSSVSIGRSYLGIADELRSI